MFKSTRIKLTILYLAIITFISVSFSLVTYRILTDEVVRFSNFQRVRFEQRSHFQNSVPFHDTDLVNETKKRIAFGLIFVNSLIILVSGGLAYFLAGKTLQPIEEMIKDQHRFIADSSHEFRTPLTSLKIAIEVALRDKGLSVADSKIVLKDNLLEVNKLQRLSDGLLRLAQYDSPEHKQTFSRVSSKKIVELALTSVETLAENKKITIKNKVRNYHILGDESELVEVLVILLDNAIKYSHEATIINLESKKTRNSLYLLIADEGIGIAEADTSHIFERFYRSDKSRSGTKGFGLGLSIAKRIVDSHNGTIKVKSEQNKGTQFIIKLPSVNNG